MSWQITFAPVEEGGEEKTVSLDDLAPDLFDQIAREETSGITWYGVYSFPGDSFERMYRVICAAADHAGVPRPDRAVTMRDAELLVGMVKRTPDIEDAPVVDGFPPQPDATEVGSTSGAPGDLAGPPTLSDDSALAIS